MSGNLFLIDLGTQGCYSSESNPQPIPQSYIDNGVPNTDLVIFVTARPIMTANVLAQANQCMRDQ